MRSQDQSPDSDKRNSTGARGSRTAAPAPVVAVNQAIAGRSSQAVLALQRAAGNAATARVVERERHVHDGGCGHGQGEERPVQRSGVDQVLRSAGTPIAGPVRRDMEARLGADFSDVRLHDDASARRSAAEVGARAYTSGSHVVIGEGGGDHRTLAHELIHVIQQRRGPVAGTDDGTGLRVSDPSDRFEREAEAGAARAMSAPTPVPAEAGPAGTAGDGVQRAVAAGDGARRAVAAGIPVQRVKKEPKPGAGGGKGKKASAAQAPVLTEPPKELTDLMRGADRQDMGGGTGMKKYRLPSIGPDVEPQPLYRAMGQQEFDGLWAGALPQGGSFQGLSTTRAYSEKYVTGDADSCTHLVEFRRVALKNADGDEVPELNRYLQDAGAPTKTEKGITSTALGLTGPYSAEVLGNTKQNEQREKRIGELAGAVEDARGKLDNPRLRAIKERELAAKEPELARLRATPPVKPAKGDAVQALNEGIRAGLYTWRLVTFRTTA